MIFVTELVIGDNTAVTEGSVIGDTSSSEKVISDQSLKRGNDLVNNFT